MSHTAFEIVKTAVEELADELGYEELRKVTQETPLFGGTDGIDSLSLVRLVAEIERAAETQFSRSIVLADERAMSRRSSPFRTVGTLSELLEERLGEAANV
ncbi:MAG: phosphopantetheine-binding protein [Pseudomonadota bacterium]